LEGINFLNDLLDEEGLRPSKKRKARIFVVEETAGRRGKVCVNVSV